MLTPTKEGVQLCLANAERLLDDATKVSKPTGCSLVELAVEELAKGYMLFFAVRAMSSGTSGSDPVTEFGQSLRDSLSKLDPTELEGLQAYAKLHLAELVKPPLEEAFRDHRVKLSYLGALVGFLATMLPLLERFSPPREVLDAAIVGRVQDPNYPDPKRIAQFQAVLSAFKSQGLDDLSSYKEAGFYVDLRHDGSLISPAGRLFKTESLRDLADYLLVGLKGVCEVGAGR
jgi:hypothetical protein